MMMMMMMMIMIIIIITPNVPLAITRTPKDRYKYAVA